MDNDANFIFRFFRYVDSAQLFSNHSLNFARLVDAFKYDSKHKVLLKFDTNVNLFKYTIFHRSTANKKANKKEAFCCYFRFPADLANLNATDAVYRLKYV